MFSCSNNEDKIRPTERPLTESVYTSVTVQLDHFFMNFDIGPEISSSYNAENVFNIFKQLSDEQGLSLNCNS